MIRRYEDLEDDEKQKLVLEDARERAIYNRPKATLNMTKISVNQSKHNSKVSLPTELIPSKEAKINTRLETYG